MLNEKNKCIREMEGVISGLVSNVDMSKDVVRIRGESLLKNAMNKSKSEKFLKRFKFRGVEEEEESEVEEIEEADILVENINRRFDEMEINL